MKKKITLKYIAKALDVSISTVSKSLRNDTEISLETRNRVQAFAKTYNYRPNSIALSLKNRKTKNIGVIIPEIVHHFFSEVISGIEKKANKHGYNVIIALSNESFDKEVIDIDMLANGSIDGFILSVSKETLMQQDYHHFHETINQGMPIVMFDRVIDEIPCDKVVVDDTEGARKAVSKLLDNGCKNIALLTTKDYISVGKQRTKGYLQALEDHQMIVFPELILKMDSRQMSDTFLLDAEKEIEKLFESNPDLDGVFAVNELYAVIAMKVARRFGKRIPQDIQVIGFTDGMLSKLAMPPLTSVSQHPMQMGKKAAGLLIKRLENEEEEKPYKSVVVKTQLVERETTLG